MNEISNSAVLQHMFPAGTKRRKRNQPFRFCNKIDIEQVLQQQQQQQPCNEQFDKHALDKEITQMMSMLIQVKPIPPVLLLKNSKDADVETVSTNARWAIPLWTAEQHAQNQLQLVRPAVSELTQKQYLIWTHLQTQFTASVFRQVVLPIIQGHTQVSLRDLEQLVTRHAAVKPIEYCCNGRFVQLFDLYKSCVKANEKKNCDPFRRYNRIFIDCGTGEVVETTIGQLKFMQFAVDHGVITYAQTLQTTPDTHEHRQRVRTNRKAKVTGRQKEKRNESSHGVIKIKKPKITKPKVSVSAIQWDVEFDNIPFFKNKKSVKMEVQLL